METLTRRISTTRAPAYESSLDVARHADAIRDWLLGGEVQISGGAHDGGVLGWIGDDAFVYPEIIGYYLSALAFFASEDTALVPECTDRARRAMGWLERHPEWTTRMYLTPRAEPDWRNGALFTFDLGMMLGGVRRWCEVEATAACAIRLRAAIADRLATISSATWILDAYRLRPDARLSELPRTWSTMPGPHHVKVAGTIEAATASMGATAGDLRAVARRTVAAWMGATSGVSQTANVHAVLYFLEGLVLQAAARDEPPPWSTIVAVLSRIVAELTDDGDIRERINPSGGSPRGDITAQALRLCAVVCTSAGQRWAKPALRRAASRLYAGLVRRYLTESGAVASFPANGPGQARQRNVWASIFAYQALRCYDAMLLGRGLPRDWLLHLI